MKPTSLASLLAILLVISSALLTADRSFATIMTFSANTDTSVSGKSGHENNSAGGLHMASSGRSGTNFIRRALFQFDVSTIPVSSTINSAKLTLTTSGGATNPPGTGDSNFGVHRLLVNWGEGNKVGTVQTGGQAASDDEATWNSRLHNTAAWGTPGGQAGTDYMGSSSASTLVDNKFGTFNWTGTGLSDDVSAWVNNSTTNHGWILISEKETVSKTMKQFLTRENATDTPQLEVSFDIPEPSTFFLAILGVLAVTCRQTSCRHRA